LDYFLKIRDQFILASGAIRTILAHIIRATSNNNVLGYSSDLYRDTYITKTGFEWLGLGFRGIIKETGMFWLKFFMFD
jgi:hypothetical protein